MPPAIKVAVVFVLLGVLGAGFMHLERDRWQKQIAEGVRLRKSSDGKILEVRFLNPEVTEEDWSLLEGSTDSLQLVDLSNTQNVAGGLAPLARYPNLRLLKLENCRWADDADVAHIAKRHRLYLLVVSGTPVTDKGMQQFDLSELWTLRAERCAGLTNETFEMLSTLPTLQSVFIEGAKITFDQYERFRLARPDLTITGLPALSWRIVNRSDSTARDGNWLTDETNIDEFVRYWKLRRHGYVHRLALTGPGVSHALPALFERIPELWSITILDTKLAGGLETLPPNMTYLALKGLHAGSDLGDLESITWLSSVDVNDLQLAPEQWMQFFSMVAANKSLRTLRLNGAEIPSGTFSRLSEHRELRSLSLTKTQMTEADLKAIGQITSLVSFRVADIPVSDAVVKSWMKLPNLANISIIQCGVNLEVEERLREQYPEARIRLSD